MARRSFLQQVADTPYGDLVATLMGPAAGPYASRFDRGMNPAAVDRIAGALASPGTKAAVGAADPLARRQIGNRLMDDDNPYGGIVQRLMGR